MNNVQKNQGFRKHKWRDKRIVSHCKRHSVPDKHVLFDAHIAAVLRAQGFDWREDPRSIYDPDQLYQTLDRYAPANKPSLKVDSHIKSGIALAYKVFAKPKEESHLLTLQINREDVRAMMSNPTGSSGLTAFDLVKDESVDIAMDSARRIANKDKVPEPCIAFKRTQFNNKTRLIWGYPFSMTILEGLFARPLINVLKGAYTPMAFGQTSGSIGARLRRSSDRCEYAYSLDMSKFDSSIASELIDIAFNIISTWFDMSVVEPTSGVTYGQIFKIVRRYFIYTPIVMPDQNVYFGKSHGVPSGSYFTQMVDSIVNIIFCGAVSSRFDLRVSWEDIFILGDDLLLWSDHLVDLDVLSAYAKEALALNVHGKEKSDIVRFDQPVPFLGRMWHNGLPDADEGEIISRLLFPERWRQYGDTPEQIARQSKLLMLSVAANYRKGWRIVRKCYWSERTWHNEPSLIEAVPAVSAAEMVAAKEMALSGSMRFKMMYIYPNVLTTCAATQYWL